MRYERKYRITHLQWQEVLAVARLNPAGFVTAFPDRQVNNIYLDTPDLQFLQDNIDGVGQRRKARIRWYGEDATRIISPNLEYKLRFNGLGTKTLRKLEEPEIGMSLTAWLKSQLSGEPHLRPVLHNSYRRSYLVSFDGRFRLTIDRDLAYKPFSDFAHLPAQHSEAVIVEVKYEREDDDRFEFISQALPWSITKNSKYVEGMMMLHAF